MPHSTIERLEEKISLGKFIARLLLAFVALMALRVRYEICAGLETDNFIVDNLSKLANQFYRDGLADIPIYVFIFILTGFSAMSAPRREPWILTLALITAVLYTIGNVCLNLGSFGFFLANGYYVCLSVLVISGCTVFFHGLLSLLYFLADSVSSDGGAPLRHPVRSGALIMFVCWLPWMLSNYPASFNPDSTYQIAQWLGVAGWSAHHPPLSTCIMGLCVSMGELLINRNFGAFLYLLLQSFCGALVFSWGLAILYRMGISRKLWTIFVLFFAVNPFWGCYMQWLEKDLLYAVAFCLTLTLLLPVLKERRCSLREAVYIALTSFIAVLLRKTGSYELLPVLVLIAFFLKKSDRKRLLAAFLAVLILSTGVNKVLYPMLNIKTASVKEALNIPFQQTARYVNDYEAEVTPEERTAIDAVLKYDELDKYTPEISDAVKSNYRENASALPEYFKHWFGMLLKHPICYFEAGFVMSYGYLAPVKPNLDACYLCDYYPLLGEMGFYRVFDEFPTYAFNSLREIFIQAPLTNILSMAGLYTWILMFCFVQLLRKKQYCALLLFVPCIINILICIASPLCASTRYELPTIAATPLIFGWTIINTKRSKNANVKILVGDD